MALELDNRISHGTGDAVPVCMGWNVSIGHQRVRYFADCIAIT